MKGIRGEADAAYLGIAFRTAPERNQTDRNSGLGSLVLPLERYVYVEKGDLGAISHCYSLCLKQLALVSLSTLCRIATRAQHWQSVQACFIFPSCPWTKNGPQKTRSKNIQLWEFVVVTHSTTNPPILNLQWTNT